MRKTLKMMDEQVNKLKNDILELNTAIRILENQNFKLNKELEERKNIFKDEIDYLRSLVATKFSSDYEFENKNYYEKGKRIPGEPKLSDHQIRGFF